MSDMTAIDYDALLDELESMNVSTPPMELCRVCIDMAAAIRALRAALAESDRDAAQLNKALAYVVKDLKVRAGTSGVVELGNGAWYQANKALEDHAAMAAQENAK